MSDVCPFCGRDPFHYVDNGVGMEAVAVTCCELGDTLFRGMRPAPEDVTLSWEEFQQIGNKLAAFRKRLEAAEEALEPFAAEADTHSPQIPDRMFIWDYEGPEGGKSSITVGHLRAAKVALTIG